MDLTALFIGIIIGLVVGFIVAWVWASARAKAKGKASSATETELKALMAVQANEHLRASHDSIERISQEIIDMKTNMMQYEQSLSAPEEDDSTNVFGEHASLFLRNIKPKDTSHHDSNNTGDQPRDFSNSGSGLFVGTPKAKKQADEEKSTN